MTDQTTPAATWDVSASVTITSEYGARAAREILANTISDLDGATHTAVEMTRNDPAATNSSYVDDLAASVARVVCDELDRRMDHAIKVHAAEQQAADGLGDQDGPAVRAEEIPGTPENLAALNRLLKPWRCCGTPAQCGGGCRDDELTDTLARAARLVDAELAPAAPAETSAEGCHRCNGSGVIPEHDGEDQPCSCSPAAPTLADLPGAAPERSWTGGLTVDQYMSWQRDDDYDGPEPSWPDAPAETSTEGADRA